jgi:hypothetical protein
VTALPAERPLRLRPDWVCEVLSRVNAHHDLVRKFRTYHRAGVPHYWTVDPETEVLTVYRWQQAGYLAVLTAARGEFVRAEPFEVLEWNVGVLFGDGALKSPLAPPVAIECLARLRGRGQLVRGCTGQCEELSQLAHTA